MPKYAFKPSCSLSKKSRIKRQNLSTSTECNIVCTPLTNQEEHPMPVILEVHNSIRITAEPFSHTDNQHILENVELASTENVSQEQNMHNELIHNISDPNIFQSKLSEYIISSRTPRRSATKLLKLLKSVDTLDCLKSLPKDSRTLLSTPRSGQVNLTKIGCGEYVHFGISTGLLHTLKHFIPVKNLSILDVWFNIDGLPIDKKGKSFWPILCAICFESTIIKPFIVGAYFGSKKPSNVQEYLYPFIEELNYLLEHGLAIDDNTININMKGIIADAPARAFIKQIKGHSGYFACEKCIEEGIYLSGSISFPNGTAQLRTDESFVSCSNEEHHVGVSPLLEISSFGLVSSIPLDYMHLCCLGIMKKILSFMIRGTLVPNSCGSIRLSRDQIERINRRMKIAAQWLSKDFSRIPLDLNDFKTYKATELRQIMLYTGPFIFKNIVSQPVYDNFLIFNIIMRILSCTKTVSNNNEYADVLAKHFLSTFCFVYGRGNVSYNVHSIIHLPQDAKKYGVVDNFSSFPFENYLQHIKKIVQPGHSPLIQLYNRITEERECDLLNARVSSIHYPYLNGDHCNGPLPDNISNITIAQYSILFMQNFTIRVSNNNPRSTKKDDCIIISSNVVGIVQNILKINGKIQLLCKTFQHISSLYNEPCTSKSVCVFECSKLSATLTLFSIEDVKFKACYLPNDLQQTTFYVCALLHTIN